MSPDDIHVNEGLKRLADAEAETERLDKQHMMNI